MAARHIWSYMWRDILWSVLEIARWYFYVNRDTERRLNGMEQCFVDEIICEKKTET